MRQMRTLLALLCTFVSAFVLGVQVAFNAFAERRGETRAPAEKPFFTADGAEWADSWSPASPNLHLFSAYLDPRGADAVVRVVGLMRLNPPLKVTCACLLQGDGHPERAVRAKVDFLQVGVGILTSRCPVITEEDSVQRFSSQVANSSCAADNFCEITDFNIVEEYCSAAGFGRSEALVELPRTFSEYHVHVQKAASFSLDWGRESGAAMAVPFTSLLLFMQ